MVYGLYTAKSTVYTSYTQYAAKIHSKISNVFYVSRKGRMISNWTFIQLINYLYVVRLYVRIRYVFNVRLNLMIKDTLIINSTMRKSKDDVTFR